MIKRVKTEPTQSIVSNQPTSLMAQFIWPRDQIAAYAAIVAYQPVRPQSIFGWSLVPCVSTPRIAIYRFCSHVIIAFKGTTLRFDDLFDDFVIATSENSCDLSLIKDGTKLIDYYYRKGYQIQLAGHSLGGKAALCIGAANRDKIVSVVALNAGAPGISAPNIGPGADKGRHYHIVGDIISTHANYITNIRVKFKGKEVDYFSPWFHRTDRFIDKQDYEIVTAQQEQEILTEDMIIDKPGRAKTIYLSFVTSLFGINFYKMIQDIICVNPIPGAQVKKGDCYKDKFVNGVEKVASVVAFSAIGLFSIGPIAAIGFGIAGGKLADGDVTGFVDLLIPIYQKITPLIRKLFVDLYHAATDGDILKGIEVIINSFKDFESVIEQEKKRDELEELKTEFEKLYDLGEKHIPDFDKWVALLQEGDVDKLKEYLQSTGLMDTFKPLIELQ